MDKQKRKDLLEQYKQIKTYMGVVKITNTANGKVLIDSFPNLKNKWFTLKRQFNTGWYANAQFQKDWNELGEQAFTYDVLEEKETDKVLDVKWELEQMEKSWLAKLQPYGDKGYNKPRK